MPAPKLFHTGTVSPHGCERGFDLTRSNEARDGFDSLLADGAAACPALENGMLPGPSREQARLQGRIPPVNVTTSSKAINNELPCE